MAAMVNGNTNGNGKSPSWKWILGLSGAVLVFFLSIIGFMLSGWERNNNQRLLNLEGSQARNSEHLMELQGDFKSSIVGNDIKLAQIVKSLEKLELLIEGSRK